MGRCGEMIKSIAMFMVTFGAPESGAPLGMELAEQLRWSAVGNTDGGAVEAERRWETDGGASIIS